MQVLSNICARVCSSNRDVQIRKRKHQFETLKTTRALLNSALLSLFLRTLEDRHRELCSSRLSGLCLGAAIIISYTEIGLLVLGSAVMGYMLFYACLPLAALGAVHS